MRLAQTEVERRLWQRLRHRQLSGLKSGASVRLDLTLRIFFCVGAAREELDGRQHGDQRGLQADERRTKRLKEQGYRVLRLRNEEVLNNIEAVLEVIGAASLV